MERAKYQQGEWTILTITDNGITIPARYKTKDWETGWNDKYGCDVLSFSVTVTKNNSYGLTSSYTGVGGSIITTSAQALSTEVLPDVNYGNAGFMNITSVSDITPLYSN